MAAWLLVIATCGIYGYYFYFTMGEDLRDYLKREELNPALDVVLAICTCGFYSYYLPFKYGRLIKEAQAKAGVSEPKNHAWMILFLMFACFLGYAKMQEELNRIWELVDEREEEGDRPVPA